MRHLRSLESEHASAVEEDMSSLPVPIERGGSLQAVLDRAFAPFIMEGANRWQPAGCGRPLRARTHVRIRTPPPVLVMELKRFAFDVRSAARVKVGTRFEFPWALDLGPYLSKADDEAGEAGAALYALRGVVLHSGTASSGHYISLVRCDAGEAEVAGSAGADALHASLSSPRGPASEKQDWPPGHVVYGSGARGPAARTLAEAEELARAAAWREANDSVVRPLSPEEVMAQSVGGGEGRRCAYLLYYDRVDGAAEAAPPALGCGLLPDAARLLDPASEAERACAASLGAAVESVRAANQAHRWERLACDADGMDATAEAVLRLSETQLAEPAPSRLMRASRALWGQQRFAAAEAADVIQAAAAGGGGASDADGKGGAAILGAAGRMSAVVGDSVRKWFVGDGAQTAAAAAGDQGCAAEGAEALLTEASARDEASLAAAAARVMTWWLGHVACCRAGEAAARVARRLHAPGSGLRLRPLHAAGLQEVELAGWAQPGADVGAAPSAFGASVVEAGSRACARVPPWRAHLMVEACCRAARAGDPAWLASTLGGDGQTGQWLARFVTCDGAPFSATDAGMAVWGPHARAWSRVLLTAVTAAACHAPVRDLWRVLRARCPAPAAAAHEAAAAVRAEWVGAGVAACAHPVPELVAAVRARHQRVPASCVSVVRAVWKAAHEAAKVGTAGAARVVALASALAAVDAGCRNEGADEAYAALHRLHESWGSVIGAEGHARAGVRALLWTTGSALTVAQEHTIMERLCGRAQGAPVPWSQVPAPLVPRCGLELVSTRAPLGSTAPQLGHALPPAGAHDASALAMLQGMLGCAMACARSEARGKRVVRTLVDEVRVGSPRVRPPIPPLTELTLPCGCESGGSRAGHGLLCSGPGLPRDATRPRGRPRAGADAGGAQQPRGGAAAGGGGDCSGGAGRRAGLLVSGGAAQASRGRARRHEWHPGRRRGGDRGCTAAGGRAGVGTARQPLPQTAASCHEATRRLRLLLALRRLRLCLCLLCEPLRLYLGVEVRDGLVARHHAVLPGVHVHFPRLRQASAAVSTSDARTGENRAQSGRSSGLDRAQIPARAARARDRERSSLRGVPCP